MEKKKKDEEKMKIVRKLRNLKEKLSTSKRKITAIGRNCLEKRKFVII